MSDLVHLRGRASALLLLAAAALALPAAPRVLVAQSEAAAPRVTLAPARPVRGRLFTVTVAGLPARALDSLGTAVAATVAGEPLHFARAKGARATALAAVPIDAPDTMSLTLVVTASGHADTTVVPFAVAAGNYAVVKVTGAPAKREKLTVAAEFGREPDSALAARIAREGAMARDIGVRSHGTPRLWRAPWTLPRPGRVTSGFGNARTFNGVVQTRHMGVDFAGKTGAPIRVANRGVVALVADFYLAGTAVYVDHGGGIVTGYFHMSKPLVAAGDTVARGQIIGRVGHTGRVTGPHLHWVMRYGAITVDPRSVMTAR
ncbi:MAG TPA: M23 family metallopeptidase [Gemmatimonadaceae bacterium]|nr:M23 family metallopeptidase [Gemmatimonadaceae bacterium]